MEGDKVQIFCTDGLMPNEVEHIKLIFNFGGDIVLIDCGVANEYNILEKALYSMEEKYFYCFFKYLR